VTTDAVEDEPGSSGELAHLNWANPPGLNRRARPAQLGKPTRAQRRTRRSELSEANPPVNTPPQLVENSIFEPVHD
jgi:hypothetical protein